MRPARRLQIALVVALSGAWPGAACTDATEVDLLQVSATGVLFGRAYLDGNGNGTADPGDAPLKNVSVVLRAPGTQTVVKDTTTDSLGIYVLKGVPLGSYLLELDASVLGDSLTVIGAGGDVTVEMGDSTQVTLGASYPALSLDEVRAAVPGRRVFTSGIVLNPRQPNGDGMVFLKGPDAYLRTTNVDRGTLGIGDSVRVLGRTAADNGQPTLDAVTPFVLVTQAQSTFPVEVTTGEASTATGGALDAALVRIRNAEITDTSTVNNDFRFWAHNGGDSVEVVLRSFLSISPNPAVRPDTVVWVSRATGLLAPFDDGSGNVRWRLLVRSASEITTANKQADVGLTARFDTLQASVGDTVEIIVTAQNAGPLTATGVQVTDTIPAALNFVSSSATSGSYDEATRLWSVGNLTAGAPADTLRIRVEVTGGPGSVANTARLRPLTREVEINGGNNTATTNPTLTVS